MNLNKYMFRKYDIRGRVNDEELNDSSVEIIGKAFGTYLKKRGLTTCVVGHDSRSYAPRLKEALVKGLLSTGINVIDGGMCTTPALYFAQYHCNAEGGAMITASHNPNGWSGIKLCDGFSKGCSAEEIQEVYRLTITEEFEKGSGAYTKEDCKDAYLQDMFNRIELGKPLKIVLNAGNAIAGAYAPQVFKDLGCEVIEQFCELDNTFPNHEPDPENKKCKEFLAKKVLETGADLGIAYDGDGDRLGIVDNKGRNIWADKTLIFLARQILEKNPGEKIVFDVKCSQLLPDDIKQHKGIPIMWKTGRSFIKMKLDQEDAALAGERSGHVFYADNWYGFDDGIYASLRLVEWLSHQQKTMAELIDELPTVVNSPTYHVACKDEVKFQIVEKLVEELKQQGHTLIDIDGARVIFPQGFALVRASNTMPALGLVFEADTQENLKKYEQVFKDLFKKYPDISDEWK